MRIITEAPVEYKSNACGCSHADGDNTGRDSSKVGKKKGFFSKEKRTARKEHRIEKREERRKNRAKKGARPLKSFFQGQKKLFHDLLHPVKQNADGTFSKTMADGSEVPVDKSSIAQLDPKKFPGLKTDGNGKLLFDKVDLGGRVPTAIMDAGVAKVATIIQEKAAVPVTTDSGEVEFYKAEDTEEDDGSKKEEGMSMTTKVLIGVVSAAVLGGIIYLATRKK